MQITNNMNETFDIKVGDWVGFKSDIEQSGQIVEIRPLTSRVVLENPNGFQGGYIGGDTITVEHFDDIWK